MKIKVRTLQNNEEEISVDNDDTILDVKKKIEVAFPEMPCDKQKLIFSGNILTDESKAVDILKENDIVIVMACKKVFTSTKNNQTKESSSTNVLKNKEKTLLPTNYDQKNAASNASEEGRESKNLNNAESALVIGEKLKETIDNICAMGFEREAVRKAMMVAFNNPNRAIDYLTNGFPDESEVNEISSINTLNGMNEMDAANQMDGANPPNETNETNETNENSYEREDNDNAPNLPNLLNNYNALAENSRQSVPDNADQFRNSPFFNILRDVALSNPQRIPEILEMIGRTDPSFLEFIRENQGEFIRAIQNYGNNDQTGNTENDLMAGEAFADQGNQNITDPNNENFHIPITPLNENEMESIKKLESLGFPKHLALEAFIACDKNEEMAANYLFENMNDYASE
ncbi:hypothetical protein C922_02156 [Plasmodium inui San Antonio 1]|uniref:UV excision repair protein RAD23 n=1 Tax=Plasmodium inui San Antonio 1 TaxID=1237626 RepID=W7A6P3_9APIC|nr:hypothetical protein C922_02156 [Plasmodium inui San Antonio 1]EUD67450.1 hypothetical protein C922_02156 [Plasmodium inui San Antonio 1]